VLALPFLRGPGQLRSCAACVGVRACESERESVRVLVEMPDAGGGGRRRDGRTEKTSREAERGHDIRGGSQSQRPDCIFRVAMRKSACVTVVCFSVGGKGGVTNICTLHVQGSKLQVVLLSICHSIYYMYLCMHT